MRDPTELPSLSGVSREVELRWGSAKSVLRLSRWDRDELPLVTGIDSWPFKVGQSLIVQTMRVQCIGPSDWMILAQRDALSECREYLELILRPGAFALVDVTDSLSFFELHGPCAVDVLSKGSGVDLHPKALQGTKVLCTSLAQVRVVIEKREAPDCFEIATTRSHAAYLYDWLNDAAAEFVL